MAGGENFGSEDEAGAMLDLSASEAHLALPDAAEMAEIAAENGGDWGKAVIEYRRRAGAGGRKPGAKNRRTADTAKYLAQFGPDPLVGMQRLASRPIDLLAAELGCSRYEAAQLQVRCMAEVAPYVHSKMAAKVPTSGAGHMTLIMQGGDGEVAYMPLGGGDAEPRLAFAETQPNQQVIDHDPANSE